VSDKSDVLSMFSQSPQSSAPISSLLPFTLLADLTLNVILSGVEEVKVNSPQSAANSALYTFDSKYAEDGYLLSSDAKVLKSSISFSEAWLAAIHPADLTVFDILISSIIPLNFRLPDV